MRKQERKNNAWPLRSKIKIILRKNNVYIYVYMCVCVNIYIYTHKAQANISIDICKGKNCTELFYCCTFFLMMSTT